MFTRLLAFLSVAGYTLSQDPSDPCVKLAGLKWVDPEDLRACFRSFKLDQEIKDNILDVVNKTLAFHTSTNYQLKAPPPFDNDVHEDILRDLDRIRDQSYSSEYDFHIDISRSVKRLNDGHCVWVNSCYDSSYLNFLPIPLVPLNDPAGGKQTVNIAPEAFSVASAEFPDQIQLWQDVLPGYLKGNLQLLDGAEVVGINGKDPLVAVNANADIAGGFQGIAARQNAFFASYQRSNKSFNYLLGNFAQQALPLSDAVMLDIILPNHTEPERINLPYRARMNTAVNFSDGKSYRSANCSPTNKTNGADYYATGSPSSSEATKFQQAPTVPQSQKHLMNVIMDTTTLSNVVLPPELEPPLPALDGSYGDGTFYDLEDGMTGVLALGSFTGADFFVMQEALLRGLRAMQSRGKTQLIVDVSNNGGGFICTAHWLHRILVGPKPTTKPEAGLDTKARNSPLARAIIDEIINNNRDPELKMLYNPSIWNTTDDHPFPADENWLNPVVNVTINGRPDQFSQRLGQECQPFSSPPPDAPLFDSSKIAIVSNGRCASSCSLFSITMKRFEGVKTVVVGGINGVSQQYCGTVGGQSAEFPIINSEIKTAHLKNHSAAPPDLMVNGTQGLTWRLAFATDGSDDPEEWKDHSADFHLPLTSEIVNKPVAIWKEVVQLVFT